MILPCHYGTFPGLLAPDAEAFAAATPGYGGGVPKVGAVVVL